MTENYYALTRLADTDRAEKLQAAERDRLAWTVTGTAGRRTGGPRGLAGAALVRLALALDGTAVAVRAERQASEARSASA